MASFPRSMQRLVVELSKLPSIGEKTAARLAYHLVSTDQKLARSLAEILTEAATNVKFCERCYFLTEASLCPVCSDGARDGTTLCVVEKPMDVIALERMGEFRGVYHVLHGVWAPLKGKGPESMKIKELVARIAGSQIKEVILATSSTVEGDATAMFVANLVGQHGIRSSRLAQGMPKGGELEYADDITLARALQGRSVVGA